MAYLPPSRRPYMIWPHDAWRIAVAGALFLFLLAWWQGWLPLPPPGETTPSPVAVAPPTPSVSPSLPPVTATPQPFARPTTPAAVEAPTVERPTPTWTPRPVEPSPSPSAPVPPTPTAIPKPGPDSPELTLSVLGDDRPWLPVRNPLLYGRTAPRTQVVVAVRKEPVSIHTAQADEFGRWQLALPDPLPDGMTWIQVYPGEEPGTGSGLQERILLVIPGTPQVDPPAITPLPLPGPLQTNIPVLSGVGPQGLDVLLELSPAPGEAPRPLATIPVDPRGRWAYAVEEPLAPGTYELWAVAVDEAGRPLTRSAPWRFTVPPDAQPIGPPQAILQVQPIPGRAETSGAPSPVQEIVGLTGTASPDTGLLIYVDGQPVGDTRATREGDWSFVFSPPVPGDGREIRVVEVDPSGRPRAISGPPRLPNAGGEPP